MRPAGEVVRTAQGLAVVRVEAGGDGEARLDYPGIGTELVDGSLTTAGEVVDVFGPVDRPYLAVTPAGRNPAGMLGERLYVR